MATLQPFLSLPPLTPEEVGQDPYQFPPTTPDMLQLATDCINVIENRVAISSFPADYQKKIKNFYRFSAVRFNSKMGKVAERTLDTLDII